MKILMIALSIMLTIANGPKPKAKNVLGTELQSCCIDPITGYYRDGYCNTGANDYGVHTVCAKYSMWNLDPSGRMKDRLSFKGYRSGHMMYLRREDLKTANDDLRDFILNTSGTGKSAKY